MKKLLTILVVICSAFIAAQAQDIPSVKINDDIVLTPKDSLLFDYLDGFRMQLRKPRYKLYPTENTWTLLKLDTVTGQIWQVQYSVDDSPRMEYVLNDYVRIDPEVDEIVCGRFVLQETKNMYNFILLDTIDGRCWQVQWNIDKGKRGVLRIY